MRDSPPAVTISTRTTRYGAGAAMAWGQPHLRLEPAMTGQATGGTLPAIEGTLIRLSVDHLPDQRDAELRSLPFPSHPRQHEAFDLIGAAIPTVLRT